MRKPLQSLSQGQPTQAEGPDSGELIVSSTCLLLPGRVPLDIDAYTPTPFTERLLLTEELHR